MITIAHRFGIRVYLDTVMNHNSFDVPGYDANTPIDLYPGFLPEDFHLSLTPDGYYRKWDNIANWGDAWQVQHRNFSDLIDIAQEPGPTNENFGLTEGSTFPKKKFVRQPANPEYYCFKWDGSYVGFGTGNGLTTQNLLDHADYYSERVEDFLVDGHAGCWIAPRPMGSGSMRSSTCALISLVRLMALTRISTTTASWARRNGSST